MGCVTKLFKLILFFALIFVAVILGPNTLPENVTFNEFHVSPVKDMGKNYAPNNLLDNVERLFEEEVRGPEGFTVLNGELYTTLHGGFVAKVFDDQVIPVVKFGEKCNHWWEEEKCGRPLGIKAVGKEHLYVADAYYGLYRYNVKNKKMDNFVKKDMKVEGKPIKTFNALDVALDGTVYYTHSSTDFTIKDGLLMFLADGSGRLMKYDPKTNTNTVLLKDLFFANGVVLSPNEDFLLVAESGHSRIVKYHLKGSRRFTSEIFIDGLPGVPDNLRTIGEDRVFVSLITARSDLMPAPFQLLTGFPTLRKFLARFMSLTQLLFNKIDSLYPNEFAKKGAHYVGHIESIAWSFPSNVTLLEMNWKGEVVRSYHGSDGSFPLMSDVIVHDGYLYMGSPINQYLGRLPLTRLGEPIPVRKQETAVPKSRPPPPPTQKPTTRSPPPPPTATTQPPPRQTPPPRTTQPPPRQTPPPPPTTQPPPRQTPPPPPTTQPPPRQTPPPRTTQPPPRQTAPPRPANSPPPQNQPNQAPGVRQDPASNRRA